MRRKDGTRRGHEGLGRAEALAFVAFFVWKGEDCRAVLGPFPPRGEVKILTSPLPSLFRGWGKGRAT